MHYAGLFPLRESGPATYLLIIAMTVTALLRLVLEPLMVGMVGVGIGAFLPFRAIAITSSLAWVAFYFILINMLQHLNLQHLSAARGPGARSVRCGDGRRQYAAGAGAGHDDRD